MAYAYDMFYYSEGSFDHRSALPVDFLSLLFPFSVSRLRLLKAPAIFFDILKGLAYFFSVFPAEIAVVVEQEDYGRTESLYLEAIAKDQARYLHAVVTKADAPDHLSVYRQLLAGQPDGSVTILTVGRLKAIGDLLEPPPDAHSPLTGSELLQSKVKEWVCMGGRYPNHARKSSANFGSHGGGIATKRAIDPWPLPVTFRGFEIGHEILTGPKLTKQPGKKHCYVIKRRPLQAVAAEIEALMVQAPMKRPSRIQD